MPTKLRTVGKDEQAQVVRPLRAKYMVVYPQMADGIIVSHTLVMLEESGIIYALANEGWAAMNMVEVPNDTTV